MAEFIVPKKNKTDVAKFDPNDIALSFEEHAEDLSRRDFNDLPEEFRVFDGGAVVSKEVRTLLIRSKPSVELIISLNWNTVLIEFLSFYKLPFLKQST